LYSQFLADGGPVPTSFAFEKSKDYELVGGTSEGKPEKLFDKNFEMELAFFGGEALFKQKIKVLGTKPFKVKGLVNFMVCDDSKCLPPEDIEFAIDIKPVAEPANGSPEMQDDPAKGAGEQHPVMEENVSSDTNTQIEKVLPQAQKKQDIIAPGRTKKENSQRSSLGIFIAGFIGGLLALLTPCVFPMIPLTVSFFTKSSGNRRKGLMDSILYGLSIIFIYVTLGMVITLSLGPDALNAMASNAFFNLAFFIIFVVFALSFLGAFEITLPSSWVNMADNASSKGGIVGIFFMAFTLSLVSFSCTGPIIGTLLVEAAVGGNVLNPALGMTGFAFALALPFGLFAAFPGWLNSLPKSGGWLNSVKVVLGLLELALALKFLSNVDLAYHWGFLKREIFIALWIIIFTILGFYLLGKIKFSHDSDTPYVSIPRLLMAIITFSFVVYLIPGMWGAPLKIISGFPPPTFYNEGWNIGSEGASSMQDQIPGADPEHCPHGLNCFHDYDLALEYSRKVNKPLMVDFTGWSCVNCRKMEDQVWVDPRVLKRLREDYVLVSLYVDDKQALPEQEQRVSRTTGKKIKTIGNRWSDLQTERYGTNSQPYYVLLNQKEELLNEPQGYDPDIDKFIQFLDQGKARFATGAATGN
jgi:thiol:disulfide interchange protein DsbD